MAWICAMVDCGGTLVRERRGMALAFVLGFLLLIGILVSTVMLLTRQADQISLRDHRDTQVELAFQSAMSYCRARWAKDSLLDAETWSEIVWVDPGRVGYKVQVKPWGAWIRVTTRVLLRGDSGVSRTVDVAGSRRNDSLPALALVSGGQDLELRRQANLVGDFWGTGQLRMTGGAHRGAVMRDPFKIARLLPPTRSIDAWWASTNQAWNAKTALDTSLEWQLDTSGVCRITGSVRDREIRCAGRARIENVDLDNVVVLANRLDLAGKVRARHVLLAARQVAIVRGDIVLDGQILAKDSAVVSGGSLDMQKGILMVSGFARPTGFADGDSLSASIVRLDGVKGRGLVVYTGAHAGRSVRDVHFQTDSLVDWSGVWISAGGARLRGKLAGTFVGNTVVWNDPQGIPWEGRLEGLEIRHSTHRQVLTWPWDPHLEPLCVAIK
ncbi:MAG: hypothetical protein IPN71_13695 [Fibrobacteres bacterium]|nr:hypothetical protein [Fibrobacterota bacterium]